MKLKTWLMLFFTFSIMGISVFLPLVLSNRQDALLFEAIHTEKLKEPSSIQLPVTSTKEKLALISSATLADSKTIVLKTSGHAEQSSVKQALELGQKSLTKLSKKKLIPETDLSISSINDFSYIVYSDADSKTSVSCYSFWAHSETYNLYVMIDADNGDIYSLRYIALFSDTAGSSYAISEDTDIHYFKPSGDTAQIWADYLGISLVLASELSYRPQLLYQIENTELFYLFLQDAYTCEIHIELINYQALGLPILDDATMMENGRKTDTNIR